MPQSLQAIDSKIAELKEKKKDLEKRQAQHLLKYLSSEIGDKFTPQLAACIVQDSWSCSPKDQKEKWLQAATIFQFTKPRNTKCIDQKAQPVAKSV
ncbi:MAG: hypothetical protein GW748_05140 [Alphaproteobacteria bacterium]|nr:hypothetical protein [Alphaproteobacteria bacterium]NCQ67111.1 hypothetical protein [Alphaproteobacteria bacterium]NCT07708.1 hypothetical protein [Alphaproteobacteria bacterium]